MTPKLEQTHYWASHEAMIKAEITEAKNTLDLVGMPSHCSARRAAFGNGRRVLALLRSYR